MLVFPNVLTTTVIASTALDASKPDNLARIIASRVRFAVSLALKPCLVNWVAALETSSRVCPVCLAIDDRVLAKDGERFMGVIKGSEPYGRH